MDSQISNSHHVHLLCYLRSDCVIVQTNITIHPSFGECSIKTWSLSSYTSVNIIYELWIVNKYPVINCRWFICHFGWAWIITFAIGCFHINKLLWVSAVILRVLHCLAVICLHLCLFPWLLCLLDDMGNRIDDLEKNIADLMTQAGVDEKWCLALSTGVTYWYSSVFLTSSTPNLFFHFCVTITKWERV